MRQSVALVTGANKGIGKETVRQLASHADVIYLACRDTASGDEAKSSLNLSHADIRVIQLDVTDADSIQRAVAQVEQQSGKLDILINNAGVVLESKPPSESDVDMIRATYDVNLFGVINLTQAMLPLLRKGEEKTIVNLSSELGSLTLHGYPDFPFYQVNLLAYNSSKTALNAFTVLLAKELQDEGFHINAVNPGYTATDLNAHSGPRSVEQAAAVVVKYATQAENGPNGGFFTDGGVLPW